MRRVSSGSLLVSYGVVRASRGGVSMGPRCAASICHAGLQQKARSYSCVIDASTNENDSHRTCQSAIFYLDISRLSGHSSATHRPLDVTEPECASALPGVVASYEPARG